MSPNTSHGSKKTSAPTKSKATKSRLAAEKAISGNRRRQQVAIANDESEDLGGETGSPSDSDSVSSDGASSDGLEDTMAAILNKGSPDLTSVSYISSRSRHRDT